MSPESTPVAEPGASRPGPIPATLRPALTDPDHSILLLVAPDAGDRYARAAVRLAEARSGEAGDTVLADGAVHSPGLHEQVGVPNLEGLADVFLFGASLGRVRTRPEDREFDFVPTGAYVPDPAAVLDSSGWDRLAAELRSSHSMLLLFVPAGTPGLGSLSRRIGRAVILAADDDVDRVQDRIDPECHVLGVIDPAMLEREAEAGPTGADEAVETIDAGAAAAASAAAADTDSSVPRGAESTGSVVKLERRPDSDLMEPVVVREERGRRRPLSPLLVVLLVALVAIVGWFLYQQFVAAPDSGVAGTPPGQVPQDPAPPVERGNPVDSPLPVSVAVEAHQDLEQAQERVTELQRAESGLLFYLAPVAVDGVLYYRLLAGPVADREAGEALLRRLVEAGHKTGLDAWAVRATTLAFDLGQYETAAEARERVASLAAMGVPTYVVRIPYESGPPHYRVYGGAYENPAEAEAMAEMLDSAGVQHQLVTRTGEPAA